tara:strand:- start:353 stop:496 length:144 start_codon:yes stop_codon:yes gene_type:complete
MRTLAIFGIIGMILLGIKSCFFIMKTCDDDGALGGQAEECLWPFGNN